jgi:hypothetical protein
VVNCSRIIQISVLLYNSLPMYYLDTKSV